MRNLAQVVWSLTSHFLLFHHRNRHQNHHRHSYHLRTAHGVAVYQQSLPTLPLSPPGHVTPVLLSGAISSPILVQVVDSTLDSKLGHITQAWPVTVLHPLGHCDGFGDDYATQARLRRHNSELLAGNTEEDVVLSHQDFSLVDCESNGAGDNHVEKWPAGV